MTDWTAILVSLSVPTTAWVRTEKMTDNQVAALSLGIFILSFFVGRLLDNALTWPLNQQLAVQFGIALMSQQTLYRVLRKTGPMQWLENR